MACTLSGATEQTEQFLDHAGIGRSKIARSQTAASPAHRSVSCHRRPLVPVHRAIVRRCCRADVAHTGVFQVPLDPLSRIAPFSPRPRALRNSTATLALRIRNVTLVHCGELLRFVPVLYLASLGAADAFDIEGDFGPTEVGRIVVKLMTIN